MTIREQLDNLNSKRYTYTHMVEALQLSPKALVYKQARERVLKDYPEWKRNEILEMEVINNKDNRFYDDFVRDVKALAEDS